MRKRKQQNVLQIDLTTHILTIQIQAVPYKNRLPERTCMMLGKSENKRSETKRMVILNLQLQDTSLSHTLAKDKHRVLGDRDNVLNLFAGKDGLNSCRMTEVNHQEKRVMLHLLENTTSLP